MTRFLRIIEILWLVVAVVAAVTGIVRASNGQSWGSYLYVTLFTAAIAAFMYFFKRRNRLYMQRYYEEKEGKAAEGRPEDGRETQ